MPSNRAPDRRQVFTQAAAWLAAAGSARPALAQDSPSLPFDNGDRPLVAYPGKRPLLRLTTRPPQLETPFSVFDGDVLTPNDAFFVRYHLANAPPAALDADKWRLSVGGAVNTPLELSLQELKALPAVELAAVNQCSGNSRGFSRPRVGGGQLGNGAMGNARWRGVPLKAVLERSGVKAGARDVEFNGADTPAMATTPDFVKAIAIDHARDGEVMLAWAMNGEDLPILNGYPLRLVVPGYYGTYWVKHLTDVTVLDKESDSYWMKTAYRIPADPCACVEPGTAPSATVPINRLNVRSFITSPAEGAAVRAGRETLVRGIAFDGGYGIAEVALSTDGGAHWRPTRLGPDLGRYSFREWSAAITLPRGAHALAVRAINRAGQSQPMQALWNPAGYMRNAVETVRVRAG
ncbi:MAG TPA: molybdopterin-dependent oxidoreductase [Caulobacteraceae bacterium]|jgi:DMSO/TMAO reductase YedYZ molybdopterin-dependent catalytic subunit|nr:molybdopterin-dependent oxidoreductase [Caulobacteraceae bacterium]